MKILIICFFNTLMYCSAFAAGHYTYSDNYVKISLEWKEYDKMDTDEITIKMTALTDILVPAEESCFHIDSLNYRGYFRNVDCQNILFTETYDNYSYCKKDSTLTYTWKIAKQKKMQAFSFDIIYIPTTTDEYKSRRNKINEVKDGKGMMVFSLSPDDVYSMMSHAKLKVEE